MSGNFSQRATASVVEAIRGGIIAMALIQTTVLGAAGVRADDNPTLGYSTYGSGAEKVLVLHDWMGNAHNYDLMIPFLDTQTFTYVFADVRGYGKSADLTGEYTAPEVATDAFHVADALGWDRFSLIGHSMTGMVVQRMLIDDWVSGRKRLKSVVALTPVPASGVQLDKDTTDFVNAVVHNKDLTAAYASVVTGGHATPGFSAVMATRQIEENKAEAMLGYLRMWSGSDFSAEALAAQAKTPLLVVGGRLDGPAFTEVVFAQTLAKWFPSIEFRYQSDAGHYVMVEAPLYTAFLIEEFLNLHR